VVEIGLRSGRGRGQDKVEERADMV
jgi:hypothetical protein